MTWMNLWPYKKNALLDDKQAFFEALGRADREAIQLLAGKITPAVRQATAQYRLPAEEVEEVVNDSVVITISNIRQGKFHFQDYSPTAYAKGVARRLLANRLRTKKPTAESLDDLPLVSDFDPETYLSDKERQSVVGQLLARLGEGCQEIIRLKFFDQLKDVEIIERQLAAFSSINSLKSKRSQCLKKLAALAAEAGISGDF